MDVILCLGYVALLAISILLFQLFRLTCADCDLTLLWASRNPCFEKLAGKVVWITGASSGIGENLCYALAQSNCKMVLSARQESELERVKTNLIAKHHFNGNNVLILPLDVLDFTSHKTALDNVISYFGQLDILINNAGRSQRSEIVSTSIDVDKALMDLNWLAPVALTKTVLPHFISRHQGHLVVTSSVAGKMSAPLSSSYSAAKHAVQGWFDTARVELAQHNIDVTLVCAGPVFSKVQNNAFTGQLGETYGIDQSPGSCMLTDRCAFLMATAIARRLKEVWIATHPILAVTYLAQYAPDAAKKILLKMGLKTISKLRNIKLPS